MVSSDIWTHWPSLNTPISSVNSFIELWDLTGETIN
jgi:hypothetical protein